MFKCDLARNDLPELSERAKIAEKLCHALGSFVGLNFKGLEEGRLWRWARWAHGHVPKCVTSHIQFFMILPRKTPKFLPGASRQAYHAAEMCCPGSFKGGGHQNIR